MTKPAVTLENLDMRLEGLDIRLEGVEINLEGLDKKIDKVDVKIDEVLVFLTEHMMMREEIEQRIDRKFSNYTSDQLDFQDQVAKRCENNEHENLGLHHRVARLEKHVGIV